MKLHNLKVLTLWSLDDERSVQQTECFGILLVHSSVLNNPNVKVMENSEA